MRIYKVAKCDSLDKWDLDKVKKHPEIDLFVYYYVNGGYDGSGMAIYRIGRKYGYVYISHCSCYGPMEDFSVSLKQLVTLTQLRDLAKRKDYEWEEYGVKALARLEEVLKGEKIGSYIRGFSLSRWLLAFMPSFVNLNSSILGGYNGSSSKTSRVLPEPHL